MTSFQIADCPTSIAIAETTEGAKTLRQGKLSLTVRNISTAAQTARIAVVPLGGAEPAWFAIEGAPPTGPQFLERDFEAGVTQTVALTLKVPPEGAAGSYTFRVRVTAEADPDNDFTESPTVSFAVPPIAVKPPPKPFPWWIVAAAAVVVVAIGVGAFVFWPKPPRYDFATLVGKTEAEAVALLTAPEVGFKPEDVTAEAGPAVAQLPGTVADTRVSGGGYKVVLVLDPGVTVPGGLIGQTLQAATQVLSGVDVRLQLVAVPVAGATVERVEAMTPEGPAQVAKDSVVTISYNTEPRPDPCDRPVVSGNLGIRVLPCHWQLWEELAPDLRTTIPSGAAAIRDRAELLRFNQPIGPVIDPQILTPVPINPNP